jgi:hypothetical protein
VRPNQYSSEKRRKELEKKKKKEEKKLRHAELKNHPEGEGEGAEGSEDLSSDEESQNLPEPGTDGEKTE